MLDLDHMLHKRARGLSADQKQKISMGRGLVRDDVAANLFDEPLTVIDPSLKWQVRRKLKQVHARFGHTLVYVTHDQNEALTFADKVVVMYEGEVVQLGTPQELFEAPAHRFVGWFIGSPGMNFLRCRLDHEGLNVEGTELTLVGRWAEQASRHPGATLEIGIRPDFLTLEPDDSREGVPVQMLKVEDLGNFRLATVGLGPHAVRVKIPDGTHLPPDLAHLVFEAKRTLLYADGKLVT
ncbi:MAG: ABC transporter ATP-binding protein [Geminicoccaceae bacterium]